MTTTQAPQPMGDLAAMLLAEFARRHWSVRQAARELGIGRSALQKIVSNPNQIPRSDTLRILADGLGRTVAELYELAGVELGTMEPAEQALVGLTDDQRAWWLSLPPSRRAQLLEAVRRLAE